jgi:hypothetical protein
MASFGDSMRLGRIIVIIGLAAITGCTTGRLRQRTINQGSTLPELQYQQVLDNLSQFATNPSALPWHVNLREGTTQITDSISGGAAIDLGPPVTWFPQLLGSRTAVAQWGMSPVIDATELRLLRIAYRRAHGVPEMPSPEFLDELAHELKDQFPSNADLGTESALFYQYQGNASRSSKELDAHIITTNDDTVCGDPDPLRDRSPLARNVCRKIRTIQIDLAMIQPGWFQSGRRRDVPKDACYVGKCGNSYVWVGPEGRDQLTEFTLTVLKITSLIKETQTLINPGSVKFSPGDRGG